MFFLLKVLFLLVFDWCVLILIVQEHRLLLEQLGDHVDEHQNKLSQSQRELFGLLTNCLNRVDAHTSNKKSNTSKEKTKGETIQNKNTAAKNESNTIF
jgi:hypothetical protein